MWKMFLGSGINLTLKSELKSRWSEEAPGVCLRDGPPERRDQEPAWTPAVCMER